MKLRNTFLDGKMNKDVDERVLPKNQYRHAENIRVSNSESSDVAAIENSLSNRQLTSFDLGKDAFTLGAYSDEFEEKIYWFVKSDTASYVLEWDNINEISTIVLKDSRLDDDNVLNFNKDYLITGVNLVINSDEEDGRLLLWTDNLNPPRQINIDRAKSYGENNFNEEDINVIKRPPIDAPEINLINSATQKENNLKEKFLEFSYRYKYLDGEYSALSPFSEYAFRPKIFSYNFNNSSNESMVNVDNAVEISINTGSDLVVEIDVIAKESSSNELKVIETFNKDKKGWDDNDIISFTFINNKQYRVLESSQLTRLYDNVPLKAISQELIQNRLVYGGYTENYNIEDCEGNPINVDYNLGVGSEEIVSPNTKKTLKSNRDYEVILAYVDEYGRMTTGLRSEGNSKHIPIGDSLKSNFLTLEINSKAPCFADYYRLFVKESKREYETIVPTLFFFEGNFIYFFIQAADVNKVKENDFVIVKADTEGIKDEVIKLKILEVDRKEEDFISEEDGGQPEGFYMKTSVLNEDVRFDANSYSFYEFKHYDQSENSDVMFNESLNYSDILFKGALLDDLSANVTYTGGVDLRYEIEIFSVDTVDTFRFRTQQTDGTFSSWDDNGGLGYDITGASQVIDSDVSITFTNTTGHSIEDRWLVKKNVGFIADEDNRSYAKFVYPDTITIGSIITLKYYSKKEKSDDIDQFNIDFISSNNYENLEEWYYGDNIYNQLLSETDFDQTLDKFWFRKVDVTEVQVGIGNFVASTFDISETGDNFMLVIESRRDSRNSSRDVYSDVFIEVRSLEQLPIFENEIDSNDFDREIYYEIGRTYRIDENRNHLGFSEDDTSQSSSNPAFIKLPVFNAFSWGNGFESYKIRDSFNATPMFINSRPISVIDDYRENFRIASLTYSQPYEQTTNFNGLNEFNLSLANFKDLDDKYGKIKKLFSRDTNLITFQEDKVLNILVNKSVLFNADGTGNVSQNANVLGQEVPYSGEYGISCNPESFAYFGNSIFFTDAKRGAVMRLGFDGLTDIAKYGMTDWYKDNFRENLNSKKIGAYDPYFNQYVLSLGVEPEKENLVVNCGNSIFKLNTSEVFTYDLKLNSLSGDVTIPYNISEGSVVIQAIFNNTVYSTGEVSGVGSLIFERDSLIEDVVSITITPSNSPTTYSLDNVCPLGFPLRVMSVIINDEDDEGTTMTSRYKWNDSNFFSETPVFQNDGVTLFELNEGIEGVGRFPANGSIIDLQAYKDFINNGKFESEESSRLGYLVTNTLYSEEDINTILSSATFPEITTINDGGVPETNKVEFNFNKVNEDDILYLIWDYTSLAINRDTYIYIYFDSSGSMASTETPLETMRDTILKDALLPLYDNDEALYDSRVQVISQGAERTLDMLNANGNEPEGNIISLVFQDEASPVYYSSQTSFDDTDIRETQYNADLLEFRTRLERFDPSYYRGVIFQVNPNSGTGFKSFIEAVQNGTGNYSGANGLSDRVEINYKYDITDGGTPEYYLEQITQALIELGYSQLE